ncbi:MAG: DUF4401 domain-containing protein [Flavipsychrobacter sp.]|nr:DUF4401 domain-containing protein [Flavipsychrobacter sp.]
MNNPDNHSSAQPSLPIKIISIIGGILASCAFVGFLFIAGLYESALAQLIFGIVFIAGAIWLDKQYNNILLDTFSISLFLIGGILIGIGLNEFGVSETLTYLIFIAIAALSLYMTQNQVLALVAMLSIHASIIAILFSNNQYEFLLVYTPLLAATCYFVYTHSSWFGQQEGKPAQLYPAIRTASTLSFLSALYLLGIRMTTPISPHLFWIASVGIIGTILYQVNELSKEFNAEETGPQMKLLLLVTLLLLPTLFAPAISGAILLVLLGFQFGYKTGFVLGILSGIYFISQYYYDLSFTLLTKSILLLISGALFLVLYFFLHKKLSPNEN